MLNIKERINKMCNEFSLVNRSSPICIGTVEVIEGSNIYPKISRPLNIIPEQVLKLTEQFIYQNLIEYGLGEAYLFGYAPTFAKVYLNIYGIRYSLEDELDNLKVQYSFIENYFD